jgi:hypothetical protein
MRAPKSACASALLPAAVTAVVAAVEMMAVSMIQANLLAFMMVLLVLALT